jgi:hypothetical protein
MGQANFINLPGYVASALRLGAKKELFETPLFETVVTD